MRCNALCTWFVILGVVWCYVGKNPSELAKFSKKSLTIIFALYYGSKIVGIYIYSWFVNGSYVRWVSILNRLIKIWQIYESTIRFPTHYSEVRYCVRTKQYCLCNLFLNYANKSLAYLTTSTNDVLVILHLNCQFVAYVIAQPAPLLLLLLRNIRN